MNSGPSRFNEALAKLPLIAILRGIQPSEAEVIGLTLYREGFRVIEVPLNSPQALESIGLLSRCLPADALLGAGTVLNIESVRAVNDAGGRLIVMPHSDAKVIAASKTLGLFCIPGASTPTEALVALHAGADALKLFPAELVTPAVLRSMRAVLPASLSLFPVGGITLETMDEYRRAGAAGFGLGSSLYKPGMEVADVAQRANQFVRAWNDFYLK